MKRPVVAVWVSLGLWCLGALPGELAQGASKSPPGDALKRKMEHYAVKGTLGAALADLASEAGVKIEADWKTLERAGVTSKTPVAVDVENVLWRQALEVMLARAGRGGQPLGWRIDAEQIVISTQKAILAMEEGASRTIEKLSKGEAGRTEAPQRTLPKNILPSVNFENLPFRDTLAFFQTASGANFHINWRAIDAAGIRADTPVSLNLKSVSIARAMDLVLDEVNADRNKFDSVYWVIDRGVVIISTGNDLNRTLITRVIDAGGALLVQPDMVGPRIDFGNATERIASSGDSYGGSGNQSIFVEERDRGGKQEESYSEQKKKHAENVITSIKTAIGADMWEPDGKGSIRVINNRLVISQTLLGFKLLEKSMR